MTMKVQTLTNFLSENQTGKTDLSNDLIMDTIVYETFQF